MRAKILAGNFWRTVQRFGEDREDPRARGERSVGAFFGLFWSKRVAGEIVVTFLALLELIRLIRCAPLQRKMFEEIEIAATQRKATSCRACSLRNRLPWPGGRAFVSRRRLGS